MDGLSQQLMQQLAGGGLTQIGSLVGLDEKTTGSALSAALPLLVSALANNAAQPNGSQNLHQALTNDHDGSILNDVSGYLSNPAAANGSGILNHVLGAQQNTVTQGLAQTTGLQTGQVAQLLQIAAPLVMGALGQQQQQQGLNPATLATFLSGQQQQAQQASPDLMSTLNSLLDTDHNGSALNEIAGMVGKLFGNN